MTRRTPALLLLVLAVVAAACSPGDPESSATTTTTPVAPRSGPTTTTEEQALAEQPVLFSPAGNNLDAYLTQPGADGAFPRQRVVTNAKEDPANGRDVNGQVCFFADGSGRFVAGEDTGQPDPPAGWGIFQLSGDTLGRFTVRQVGKLTPTYQPTPDGPDNFGCGFLSGGRVVTLDIGNAASGDGNGQVIVWFPPYDSRDVKFCKLVLDIATGQQLLVKDDVIYAAGARGGVTRLRGPFPTGPDAAGGCGRTDNLGSPLADSVQADLFIRPGENDLATTSGLAEAPDDGVYVSSVLTGVINEYGPDGSYRRTVLRPPAGETLAEKPYSTGTPLGLAAGSDGTLYYADIGLVSPPGKLPGPGDGTGTVRRIRFENGEPQPPETMASGLDFPDGLGLLERSGGAGFSPV